MDKKELNVTEIRYIFSIMIDFRVSINTSINSFCTNSGKKEF